MIKTIPPAIMLIDANASVAYVGALPVAVVRITGASSISSSPFLLLPFHIMLFSP